MKAGWANVISLGARVITVSSVPGLRDALDLPKQRRIIWAGAKKIELDGPLRPKNGSFSLDLGGARLWHHGIVCQEISNFVIDNGRIGPVTRNMRGRGGSAPEPCPTQPRVPGDCVTFEGVEDAILFRMSLRQSADELVSLESTRPSRRVSIVSCLLYDPAPRFHEDYRLTGNTHARAVNCSRGTTEVGIYHSILHNGERRMPQFSGPGKFHLFGCRVSGWKEWGCHADSGALVAIQDTEFVYGETPHAVYIEDREDMGTRVWVGSTCQGATVVDRGGGRQVNDSPWDLREVIVPPGGIYGPAFLNSEELRVISAQDGGVLRHDLGENPMDCRTGYGELRP